MPLFNRKILCLDIGSSAIKWMLFNERKRFLYDWGISEIPRGWVKSGRIIEQCGVAQKINEILRSSGGKPSGVLVSLFCPEMIIRTVMLPKLDPKELESVIKFEVEHLLPQGAEKYVADYKVLGEVLQQGTVQVKVLIAAVPSEIVKGYLALFKRLSLKPLALDFHGSCISRTVGLIKKGAKGERQLVVDIGASNAAITIVENDAPVFTRLIHISNNEHLFKDVCHSIEFFKTRSGSSIDSIIMVGGSSHLKELGSRLSSVLGIREVALSAELQPDFKGEFPCEQAEAFANVLGLALGDRKKIDRDINLLPEEYRDTRKKRRAKGAKVAAVILAGTTAAGAILLPLYYIDGLKSRSTVIRDEAAGWETIMEYRENMEALRRELELRKNAVEMLKSRRREWSSMLDKISCSIPNTVFLVSVSFAYPDVLKITGEATDYAAVARLAVKLGQIEDIVAAEPVSIAASRKGTFDFELRCLLRSEADEY
jgi:Tfp pilus assembly PilM family ATPase/Tfp pilus assembly protein PilN